MLAHRSRMSQIVSMNRHQGDDHIDRNLPGSTVLLLEVA